MWAPEMDWQLADWQLAVIYSTLGTVARATRPDFVLLSVDNVHRFLFTFAVKYFIIKLYSLLYLVVIYPHFLSPLRHLPGPKDNHPFFGQFIKIILDPSPIGLYTKWHNQWPRAPFIRYLGLFNEETLIVNTPEAHKEVLQSYSFVKPGQLYRLVGDVTGLGLPFSEEQDHRRRRRLLNARFHPFELRNAHPVIQDSTERMALFFESQIDDNGRVVVDTVDTFFKVAFEIASKAIIGIDLDNLNSLRRLDLNFRGTYQRTLQPSALSALISFVTTAIPVGRWIPLKANTGYVRVTQNLRRMLRPVIDKRLTHARSLLRLRVASAWRFTGWNILTRMAWEKAEGEEEPILDAFRTEEMVDQALTLLVGGHELLVGGHETSATALTWCMYALATRPELQERIRDELRGLEKGVDGRYKYYGGVAMLSFLHNFLLEVLRRWAPVALSFREADEDMTVCGTFIPEGTLIALNFSQLNLCRAIWGDDAEQFRPERWESLSAEAASPYAFGTFSNGKRGCIGKGFAFMEIKCVLVEILTRFRVLPTPEMARYGVEGPPLQNPSITLGPKGGMKVVLEKLRTE